MSFEGPLSPLGIASRYAFKQEVKSALTEDIGSAAVTFAVVFACFIGCFLVAEATRGFLDKLDEKDGCGCSRSR